MSSYDPVALAAEAAASPARSAPQPLPAAMTYTSLGWLAREGEKGVPSAVDATPPTSPDKRRVARASTAAKVETPEQRQQRQEAFKRTQAAELARILQAKQAGTLTDPDGDERKRGGSAQEKEEAPHTPPRKARLAPSAAAAAAESAAASSSGAAASLVSPEKRRAKKLSSLQFPIFCVYWWDYPPPQAAEELHSDSPSSSAIAKAARVAKEKLTHHLQRNPPSLGTVLLGGGGGKAGAGIDSGMLVCSVLPSSAPIFSMGNSPIRMSSVSSKSLLLHPTAFLDSHDYLIGHLTPHPHLPVLAATVGAGTAILEATPALPDSGDESEAAAGLAPPPNILYRDLVQTDFSKELNAQAQAWSPSGTWLVTGGEDRVLRAWSYPSLDLLAVLGSDASGEPNPSTLHRHGILSLDVNSDGTRVASCAGDGSVKIWNTARLEHPSEPQHPEVDPDAEQADEIDPAERAAWASSALRRCPHVRDITISLIKGSLLKFQAARFYGRKGVGRRPCAAAAAESKEHHEESKSPASAAAASEFDPHPSAPEYLLVIASQIRRGGGASSLIKFTSGHGGLGPDDDEAWTRVKHVSLGQAALTCMELSDDEHSPLVALANTEGQVAVYAADSMRCIKRVAKVHDLPTTGLAFSPARLSAATDTAPASSRWLLSASADKSVALIELPTAAQRSTKRLVVYFALALLLLVIAIALGKEPWNLPPSDL